MTGVKIDGKVIAQSVKDRVKKAVESRILGNTTVESRILGNNTAESRILGNKTERGCRHISDLLAHAATIAFQTLWSEKEEKLKGKNKISLEEVKSIGKKFENSCYAYKKDGEVYNQFKEILINKVKEGWTRLEKV